MVGDMVLVCYSTSIFIILVCNFAVVVQGVGETANVEFLSVEDGLDEYSLGEMKDVFAQSLIIFDDQHPHFVKSKELKIRNTT